jgi:hypothetical protein
LVPPGAVYVPGGSGSDADFNTPGTFFITSTDTNYIDSDGNGDLIVEGKPHFYGYFEFRGLVIGPAPGSSSSSGTEEELSLRIKNYARIFGSLLLGPNQAALKFDIKDNGAIRYSSQGLSKAVQVGSRCIPMPSNLIAWHELSRQCQRF